MAHLSPMLNQATPIIARSGSGLYITDEQGRQYLDFTAGVGVTTTGHCHPRVVAAVQEQAGRLLHGQYLTLMHSPLLDLCDRLGEVLPDSLDSLFFANSGSEAVESAMRLARQATGRPNIIAFQGGFHGRTVGAASMTSSSARFRSGYAPLMGGVHIAPFPYAYRYGWDVETATRFALRELDFLLATASSPEDTAALIVEPVLGEGGFVPANEQFMVGLRERADRHGALLILDEVHTGFGRTGRFWGHEHFRVVPDILVAAKGLTSGFPLSLMAASEELMSKAWPGSQGSTYGGNAVACAAALATLDVIRDEELIENAATMGRRLFDGVSALQKQHASIGDVRGLGLMIGAELSGPDGEPDPGRAKRIQLAAVDRGLLIQLCGTFRNVLRLIPALTVTREQIDQALGVLAELFAVEAAEDTAH